MHEEALVTSFSGSLTVPLLFPSLSSLLTRICGSWLVSLGQLDIDENRSPIPQCRSACLRTPTSSTFNTDPSLQMRTTRTVKRVAASALFRVPSHATTGDIMIFLNSRCAHAAAGLRLRHTYRILPEQHALCDSEPIGRPLLRTRAL